MTLTRHRFLKKRRSKLIRRHLTRGLVYHNIAKGVNKNLKFLKNIRFLAPNRAKNQNVVADTGKGTNIWSCSENGMAKNGLTKRRNKNFFLSTRCEKFV